MTKSATVPKPRAGKFADKPGAYRLVGRTDSQLIDPGERLRIEVFATGYGEILAGKIVAYPDIECIDPGDSRIRFNMREVEYDTGKVFYWGGTEVNLSEDGINIDLTSGGMVFPGQSRPTLFFDAYMGALSSGVDRTPPLSTEQVVRDSDGVANTVLTLDLKIRKSARPGPHSLGLVLTYFNGDTWAVSDSTVSFSVRNFYQRNEIKIWIAGVLLALIGLIPTGG